MRELEWSLLEYAHESLAVVRDLALKSRDEVRTVHQRLIPFLTWIRVASQSQRRLGDDMRTANSAMDTTALPSAVRTPKYVAPSLHRQASRPFLRTDVRRTRWDTAIVFRTILSALSTVRRRA